jgi:hypothetical protein
MIHIWLQRTFLKSKMEALPAPPLFLVANTFGFSLTKDRKRFHNLAGSQ